MPNLDDNYYVDLIERRYFGGVVAADFGRIRDSFTDDALVLIRHGDGPAREFAVTPENSDSQGLMAFYEHICGQYDCWFGNFVHYMDANHDRAASRFLVRLTPKAGGEYDGWPVQELNNCNFFDFRDGLIQHMIVYYSNPTADQSTPTGYPQS
jgi:hypothetical protein